MSITRSETALRDSSTLVSDPEAERVIHPCWCAGRPSDLAHTSSLQFTIFYQIIFSMIATCWRLWLGGLEGDNEEDVDEDVVTDTIGYLEPEGLVIQYNSSMAVVCFPEEAEAMPLWNKREHMFMVSSSWLWFWLSFHLLSLFVHFYSYYLYTLSSVFVRPSVRLSVWNKLPWNASQSMGISRPEDTWNGSKAIISKSKQYCC